MKWYTALIMAFVGCLVALVLYGVAAPSVGLGTKPGAK